MHTYNYIDYINTYRVVCSIIQDYTEYHGHNNDAERHLENVLKVGILILVLLVLKSDY